MTYNKPELVFVDTAARVVLGEVKLGAFDQDNQRPDETEIQEW